MWASFHILTHALNNFCHPYGRQYLWLLFIAKPKTRHRVNHQFKKIFPNWSKKCQKILKTSNSDIKPNWILTCLLIETHREKTLMQKDTFRFVMSPQIYYWRLELNTTLYSTKLLMSLSFRDAKLSTKCPGQSKKSLKICVSCCRKRDQPLLNTVSKCS